MKTKMKTKTKMKNKMKTKTKMKIKINFPFCFHFRFYFCFCFHFLFCFWFSFLVFIFKFHYGTSKPPYTFILHGFSRKFSLIEFLFFVKKWQTIFWNTITLAIIILCILQKNRNSSKFGWFKPCFKFWLTKEVID